MPWNREINSTTDYDERRVEPRDSSRRSAQPTARRVSRYQVAQTRVEEFKRDVRKTKIVEIYHVSVAELSEMTRKPSKRKHRGKLKSAEEPDRNKTYVKMKEAYKNDGELTKILDGNRSVFRTKLPDRLPQKKR